MLPPNLTRHLYETQRLIAADEGRELPPWYRLTPQQQAAAETDMNIFRQAILRAEEEQDLVAAFNASNIDTTQPTADTAVDDCTCPGCSAVGALLELMAGMLADLEYTVQPDTRAAAVVPLHLRPGPLADEGRDRPQKTAGKPGTGEQRNAPDSRQPGFQDFAPRWLTLEDLIDLFGQSSTFDRVRRDFWEEFRP